MANLLLTAIGIGLRPSQHSTTGLAVPSEVPVTCKWLRLVQLCFNPLPQNGPSQVADEVDDV